MNINFKASKYIHKVERRIGKENITNSKYLIIKRESKQPLGLFAYFITNLGWVEYAVRSGLIPIIDMKNYYNYLQQSEVDKINTWEFYFSQVSGITVDEALKSGQARYVWSDLPEYQPNESLDFLLNPNIVSYYRKIALQYMKFNDNTLQQLEEERKRVLEEYEKERIVGVLARGSDYTTLKPFYHPIQPTVEQMVEKIDKYKKKYDCKKVYVATEDAYILRQLQKKYGENLLYTNQKRICGTTRYLNNNKEFTQGDPYERGLEYLKSIYLLSKCTGIIAGRTSGTVGAVLLAQNYEFQYFFTLGRYGIEDTMIR